MLANFTIAIPRGVLLKVAGWAMVAHVGSTEPWYIGGVIGLFLLGAASTKDFADIEGDRAGGCRTLPILYGPKKAAWIISAVLRPPLALRASGRLPARSAEPVAPHPHRQPGILTAFGVLFTLWGAYTVWLLLRDPDSLTDDGEPPVLEAHVPDDDGRADRRSRWRTCSRS